MAPAARLACASLVLLLAACADLKRAPAPAGGEVPAAEPERGGDDDDDDDVIVPGLTAPTEPVAPTSTGTRKVEAILEGRDRLGDRGGTDPTTWSGGLVQRDYQLYWVESGLNAGVHHAPTTCRNHACVRHIFAADTRSLTLGDNEVFWIDRIAGAIRRAELGPDMPATPILYRSSGQLGRVGFGDGMLAFTEDTAVKMVVGTRTPTLADNVSAPTALAATRGQTFWAADGALRSTRGDVAEVGARLVSIAARDNQVYYALKAPWEIWRHDVVKGTTEVVAVPRTPTRDLFVDGGHAYWVEAGTEPEFADGRVLRVAHGSTATETLATGIVHPIAVTANAGEAFVLSAGTRESQWKDGKLLVLRERPTP